MPGISRDGLRLADIEQSDEEEADEEESDEEEADEEDTDEEDAVSGPDYDKDEAWLSGLKSNTKKSYMT